MIVTCAISTTSVPTPITTDDHHTRYPRAEKQLQLRYGTNHVVYATKSHAPLLGLLQVDSWRLSRGPVQGSGVELSWAWAPCPMAVPSLSDQVQSRIMSRLRRFVRVPLFTPDNYKHLTPCKAHCIDCCVAAPGQLAGKSSPANCLDHHACGCRSGTLQQAHTRARHCSPRRC
jgi:hypothetical protein